MEGGEGGSSKPPKSPLDPLLNHSYVSENIDFMLDVKSFFRESTVGTSLVC